MAAPTFTQITNWTEGGTNGKRIKVIKGTLTVDGTVGAAIGDIGLAVISGINGTWTVFEAINDIAPNITPTAAPVFLFVSYDNTSIQGFSGSAIQNVPAGTYKVIVKGY